MLYLVIGAPIMYLYVSTTGNLVAKLIKYLLMRLNCCAKSSSSAARKKKQHATKVSLGTASQQQQQQQQPRRVRLLTPTMKDRTRRQSQDSPQQQYNRRHTWQTKGSGSVVVANNPHHMDLSTSEESLLFASTSSYSMTIWPLLISALLLIGIYVSCGAALLAADGSKWTYGEAFYFCFVSLFTVGFGGLRPDDSNLYSCVTYIFLGLAVLSTCFFLLKDDCFAVTRFLREGGRSRKSCSSKSLSASSSSSTTLALNSLRRSRKDGQR